MFCRMLNHCNYLSPPWGRRSDQSALTFFLVSCSPCRCGRAPSLRTPIRTTTTPATAWYFTWTPGTRFTSSWTGGRLTAGTTTSTARSPDLFYTRTRVAGSAHCATREQDPLGIDGSVPMDTAGAADDFSSPIPTLRAPPLKGSSSSKPFYRLL